MVLSFRIEGLQELIPQSLDAVQHLRVAYGRTIHAQVAKPTADALAPDARLGIRHVAQSGRLC